MNKINIGSLAVSRYHQLRRFFPTDDQPQYSDHDFPLRKSKILPPGYMVLEKPTESHVLQSARRRSRSLTRAPTNAHTRGVSGGRSQSWNERHDHEHPSHHLKEGEVNNLQRFHWPTPHSGRLFTFNRAARFHDATCSQHYSDLYQLIGRHFSEKGVLSLLVDGEPDYSPKHLSNILIYGQLWHDCNLDCLLVTTHSGGNSAYNPIEHAWSVLSRSLSGVTLPFDMPDEVPLAEQEALTAKEHSHKAAEAFDHSLSVLNGYWNGLKYDGFPVYSTAVPSLHPPRPQPKRTAELIDQFVNSSPTAI